MTDDPDRFPRPVRNEPRGPFPVHHDGAPPGAALLAGPEALALARAKLAEWVAAHPAYPTAAADDGD